MPSTVLQLTAADVKRRENPQDIDGLFTYGDSESISEAYLDEIIAEQEDVVISGLPEGYAELARGEVTGEILTQEAVGTQLSTLQLSLFPVVTGSVVLYVDYGGALYGDAGTFPSYNPNKRPYSDRKLADRYDTDNYTVNLTTGAVTLSPALTEGQSVYADYRHTATQKAKMLRHVCLVLISAEIYQTFPNYNVQQQDVRQMREAALAMLGGLYGDGKPSGIQLFDQVKLVDETRKSERKALKIPLMNGM